MSGVKKYHVPRGDPCSICGYPPSIHRVDHVEKGFPCEICGVYGAKHRTRIQPKAYHVPIGDPCALCRLPAYKHRVDHIQEGDPCTRCGVSGVIHRPRERVRFKDRSVTYIGIDGEGQGRRDHRYIMLAATDEYAQNEWVLEGDRLTTVQCLDFLLKLPSARTKIFGYSFNYDLTKILEDVDNETLYKLFRPDHVDRRRASDDSGKGPIPVKWRGYSLNFQGTKFTVSRGGRTAVIWDLFKFFQGKFVQALKDWKIGEAEEIAKIAYMKERRSELDKESRESIRSYCLSECRNMGHLARKLTDAHDKAGIPLRSYYGAGSSAKAMLSVMGIREKIVPAPIEMKEAVASAFSGGRFENSGIGPFPETLFGWDISSAYPYQTTFLPCLIHGRWEYTTDRNKLSDVTAALVRYRLEPNHKITDWGPFPFRTADGSISYPIVSGGGWVWRDEYLQGESLFPNVIFLGAWLYHRTCRCQPFKRIPQFYLERLKLGKDGPGIVIKLAVNACYGSLAQSVGNAIFNSWIWAGMITSGCRAQILEFMGLHKDRSNMLMVATDGIYTRENIAPPFPRETGTGQGFWNPEKKRLDSKPLGGWEGKTVDKGMFLARPGVYFPLDPTDEEIKEVRARGIGKGVLLEHWRLIVDAWAKDGIAGTARIPSVTRFCGAKTSIHYSATRDRYTRAKGGWNKKEGRWMPHYGQWIERPIQLSFHPMPKRDSVNPDGRTLSLRVFPKDLVSVPYNKALRSKESIELEAAYNEALEQPDAELSDYEEFDFE